VFTHALPQPTRGPCGWLPMLPVCCACQAVTQLRGPDQQDEALALLTVASAYNPWVAEPQLLMAQILLHR